MMAAAMQNNRPSPMTRAAPMRAPQRDARWEAPNTAKAVAPKNTPIPIVSIPKEFRRMDGLAAKYANSAPIADLVSHDCIVLESLGSVGRWDFSHGWLDYDGPSRSRIAVNTAEASFEATLQGL